MTNPNPTPSSLPRCSSLPATRRKQFATGAAICNFAKEGLRVSHLRSGNSCITSLYFFKRSRNGFCNAEIGTECIASYIIAQVIEFHTCNAMQLKNIAQVIIHACNATEKYVLLLVYLRPVDLLLISFWSRPSTGSFYLMFT
ncbi:unnamed protein product [Amoebophrya sp. A120]|nr:unnamed protein product [Amoebophrya sp. A120]|eukprot:GSA120T00025545001.1